MKRNLPPSHQDTKKKELIGNFLKQDQDLAANH
jgi:hypothetical protein